MAKMVAASAAVALATACSAPVPEMLKADGVERVSVDGMAYASEFRAFRESAFGLGEALLADGGNGSGGNVVSSPGSVLVALAMLRAGATGETAAEMDAVMGLPENGRDEAMNALLASLAKFDGDPGAVDEDKPPRHPVLHTANGLFVDDGVPTGEAFLSTLARHYGTGVYPVDFANAAATKPAIDAWVDRNTGGRIKQAPADYDPRNTFSLLNSVYFAAAWREPFDPVDTSNTVFTKAGGEQVMVPAMNNVLLMPYAEGAGWRGVDLPYAEGFVMRLVLPDAGSDAIFGASQLGEIADALDAAPHQTVQIQLPRWDHKSRFDLREVLASLGLDKMLITSQDFNAIQPGLQLTQLAQAANITVAEKGTVAAAATQFNGAVSGAPMPAHAINFDRPFHYQVVHVDTGLPLFMGTVADPRS
ncbi:serpin family protein [Arthrobacter sp. NPDC056691]|uniref:serpin family protein n=1 Tax=Arthrobacter sp. NPDC056691 TaxID=3345913 RepID=UPI00366BA64C